MNKKNSNAVSRYSVFVPRTPEELVDETDALVAAAARGDQRAVGAIAIALSPHLVAEARHALGPANEQDDADVVQELMVKLLEGALTFPPIRGAGLPWLARMVRVVAQDWLRRKGPPEGMAG